MKRNLTSLFILVSGLLVFSLLQCRRTDPQNEILLKPWTGIFFEDRNLSSMGLRGPVSEVIITRQDNISYDTMGMLLTDTGSLKPSENIYQEYYRFNRSGLIVSSVENNEVFRTLKFRKRSGELSGVIISGNQGDTGLSGGDLELLTMKMEYNKRKLSGLSAQLSPFDLEDYFRDISLHSEFTYKDMGDSSSCTEDGKLCITIKPGSAKTDDSLGITHNGFMHKAGTDSFFYAFRVTYIRNKKGLLLSKTTETPGPGFYGIIEPGREQLSYYADGKLKERHVSGGNNEHYYYNVAGKDSVQITEYQMGVTLTELTDYDKRGNRVRKTVLYRDKGHFKWSRTSSYRYDDRDSLTEIMESAVVNIKKEEGGQVPFFGIDPFVTRFTYNDKGLLTEQRIYTYDSLLSSISNYVYTKDGRLMRETTMDFSNGVKIRRVLSTEYQYDSYGNKVRKLNYSGDRLVHMERWDFRYY